MHPAYRLDLLTSRNLYSPALVITSANINYTKAGSVLAHAHSYYFPFPSNLAFPNMYNDWFIKKINVYGTT